MIDQKLLLKYRNGEINLVEMAHFMGISHQNLSCIFKKEGILSNKALRQDVIKHDFFNIIDTYGKAYLLGYFVADGSITKSKKHNTARINFSCTDADIELLETVKKLLNISNSIIVSKKRYKVKNTDYLSKPMASLKASSLIMFNILSEKGFGQNKTYSNYNLPNFENKDLFFKFLLGLFDGDGGINISEVSKNNGKYKYINYCFYITSNCKDFLSDIKIKLSEYDIKSTISQDKNSYRISIFKKKDIIKLKQLMYLNMELGLKRKKNKLMSIV